MLRTIAVDVETKEGDIFDKTLNKWTEIPIIEIFEHGKFATVKTQNNEFMMGLPTDSFEKLAEEKKVVTL